MRASGCNSVLLLIDHNNPITMKGIKGAYEMRITRLKMLFGVFMNGLQKRLNLYRSSCGTTAKLSRRNANPNAHSFLSRSISFGIGLTKVSLPGSSLVDTQPPRSSLSSSTSRLLLPQAEDRRGYHRHISVSDIVSQSRGLPPPTLG